MEKEENQNDKKDIKNTNTNISKLKSDEKNILDLKHIDKYCTPSIIHFGGQIENIICFPSINLNKKLDEYLIQKQQKQKHNNKKQEEEQKDKIKEEEGKGKGEGEVKIKECIKSKIGRNEGLRSLEYNLIHDTKYSSKLKQIMHSKDTNLANVINGIMENSNISSLLMNSRSLKIFEQNKSNALKVGILNSPLLNSFLSFGKVPEKIDPSQFIENQKNDNNNSNIPRKRRRRSRRVIESELSEIDSSSSSSSIKTKKEENNKNLQQLDSKNFTLRNNQKKK